MNAEHSTSKLHIGLLVAAMACGAIMTRFVPDYPPVGAQYLETDEGPAIRAARSTGRDASRDISGIEVDMRRLLSFARIG